MLAMNSVNRQNCISSMLKIDVDCIKYGLEFHEYYVIDLLMISYNGWKKPFLEAVKIWSLAEGN